MSKNVPEKKLKKSGVEAFLRKVQTTPVRTQPGSEGRLIFAMDATASRQFAWDQAAHIQTEMFLSTSEVGGLAVQLAFFRGFGEFKVSKWTTNSSELKNLMQSVSCAAGVTQIRKVLKHSLNETKKKSVNALVFVGDSMEEDIDILGETAGELGLFGVPVFMFQEGYDPIAQYGFNQVAKLTGGACVNFDSGAVEVLRELLGAVAVFASGGKRALEAISRTKGNEIKKITEQVCRN